MPCSMQSACTLSRRLASHRSFLHCKLSRPQQTRLFSTLPCSLPAHIPPRHLLPLPLRPTRHFKLSPAHHHLIATSFPNSNLVSPKRPPPKHTHQASSLKLTESYRLSRPPQCARQEQRRRNRTTSTLITMCLSPPQALRRSPRSRPSFPNTNCITPSADTSRAQTSFTSARLPRSIGSTLLPVRRCAGSSSQTPAATAVALLHRLVFSATGMGIRTVLRERAEARTPGLVWTVVL